MIVQSDKQRKIRGNASFLLLYLGKKKKTMTDAKQKQTDYKVMKAEKTLPDMHRPKNKVSVTSSDGYRQRASRKPSTDPTTEKDSFNTENNTAGQSPRLAGLHTFCQRNTLQDFEVLQGVHFWKMGIKKDRWLCTWVCVSTVIFSIFSCSVYAGKTESSLFLKIK